MNLCIDIGNSFIKIAIFEHKNLVLFQERLDYQDITKICETYPIHKIMVCDVANKIEPLLSHISTHIPKNISIQKLNFQTQLPITNLYETPQTLGMDRLAAVLGAYSLFRGQNCMIIDAGSCITYDFLSATGVYYGGSISLGLAMRFRALHEFTAKLPLLSPSNALEITQIGKTTEEAMQSGVIHGFLYEIDAIIANFTNKYANDTQKNQVLICGGDADFLHKRLKSKTQVLPTLLLNGLNELIHN